jgi:dihydroxyacetone kinase
VGSAGFTLAADEIELGLGIHGEAGVRRAKLASADEIVDQLLTTILADLAPTSGARVALLVNGLGGTPPMELAIAARKALAQLRASGLHVARAWSGNLMTALEMPGISLSLLVIDEVQLARLDAATDAPRLARPRPPDRYLVPSADDIGTCPYHADPHADESRTFHASVGLEGCRGIGCLGSTAHRTGRRGRRWRSRLSMTRAASAIRAMPASDWATPPTALKHLAAALGRAIAGSSGPFYATALVRAARGLPDDPGPYDWAEALDAAAAAITELGGARPGDRTMLDALVPAAAAFRAALDTGKTPAEAWTEALDAAREGTAATAHMHPRVGRAAYLGDRALGHPDAGATAMTIWLTAITPT